MMKEKNELTRRNFLKTTAALTAGMATFSARSYGRIRGANDRLNIGFIGCGSIAGAHLRAILDMSEEENAQILAVCDVYETRARTFQDRIWRIGGNAKSTRDYRDVLALRDVDKVIIATPEHWHARLTLEALEANKHVYCEKPLTYTIAQSQAVVAKARETGLKLQVGVQGMSDDSYSSAYEAVRAGKLGPVIEAQIDYVRNYPADSGPWRTGVKPHIRKPPDLDWEGWLGPAPKRPWSASRYYEWRAYKDYSGGIATDLFIHRITRILKACGLTYPSRVVGMGGIYLWTDGRELPDNLEMLAEYPAVGGITPGMTLHVLGTMGNRHGIEHCIRGHRATLIFTPEGWKIVEQGSNEVLETHQKTGGEDVSLHHKNHHAAIRDGVPLACPPELGMYGVVVVGMANESWFQKKMLAWDSQRNTVTSV
ncbi:Gfo/Idh/MocA family oxidoreductase [Acidobacteria bacterium AH-259-L09]|nr:Gfo/Idh/MocA family oxidoreductase [Acidobacteria bacterium AH-259-L09]